VRYTATAATASATPERSPASPAIAVVKLQPKETAMQNVVSKKIAVVIFLDWDPIRKELKKPVATRADITATKAVIPFTDDDLSAESRNPKNKLASPLQTNEAHGSFRCKLDKPGLVLLF
jgi:hypothetical protein